ncbi:MAG: CPBP family intramembrane metalloprotease [Bacteroidaceae bacterium]|nr:CPBP family intramembrane metalloprotease [Bacteroidaceae bacterium]
MGKIRKTLISIGLWGLLQIIVGITFAIVSKIRGVDYLDIMAPALLISNLTFIIILWIIRFYKIKELGQSVPSIVLLMSLVLGFCALYAVDILSMPFNLPNNMAAVFDAMVKNKWGFLSIAIVGPIAEEVLMRRVILTEIAQATGKKWWGIFVSAFLFALIHGNPLQIFFALPAGILLGWLYCKTGRLIVPICVHIMNNSISFFSIKSGEQSDMQFTDTLTQVILYACIAVTVTLVIWFNIYYSRHETDTALPIDDKAVQVIQDEPVAESEQQQVTEQ